jgi:hypothetical protein
MTPIYHLQTANFNNIGSCKSNVQAWCSVPYSALLFLHKQKCRTVLAYSYMKKLCLLFTHAALSTICLNLGVHSHVIALKARAHQRQKIEDFLCRQAWIKPLLMSNLSSCKCCTLEICKPAVYRVSICGLFTWHYLRGTKSIHQILS